MPETKDAPLTPQTIRQGLHTKQLGQVISCFSTLDSTNEAAKRLAADGAPSGTVITAEEQTHGKGRLGRHWENSRQDGLYMSVLLDAGAFRVPFPQLTLLAGLAVCRAVRKRFAVDARIKWPNDLVVGGRKLCGILTEAHIVESQPAWAVVGIGLNVNQQSFSKELAQRATSLRMETGHFQSRLSVLQAILEAWEPLLQADALPAQYAQWCVTLGRTVHFIRNGKTLTGKAIGISQTGALQIALPSGATTSVTSGEITVQGIYGA